MFHSPHWSRFIFAAAASLLVSSSHAVAKDDAAIAQEIEPFLAQHCVGCHGEKDPEGGLRLDAAALASLDENHDARHTDTWHKVFERLATGDMPPADEPRPPRDELVAVVGRLHDSLVRSGHAAEFEFPDKGNHVPHELLFGPLPENVAPSAFPARLWRLSPYQYRALVAAVGGDRYKPVRGFATKTGALPVPFSFRGGPGLQDYASLYGIDEGQTEQLVLNARDLARRMFAISGEQLRNRKEEEFKTFDKYHTPKGLETIVAQQEKLSDEQIDQFLNVISSAVLRRPPTDDERRRYGDFLRQEAERFGNRTALENVLAAYLLHPAVMFRVELPKGPTDEHGRTMFDSMQLAQAIAYALNDSPPENRLLEAAKSGRLQTRDDVRREVERLLAESLKPRETSASTIRILRFFQEFFGYTAAPLVFKDDDLILPELREQIVTDTDRLIESILITDRQVLRQLLTTRNGFVMGDVVRRGFFKDNSGRGASHPFGVKNHVNEAYNLAIEDWSPVQPLEFPANQRAGILTQPSWLIAHSTNDSNDAIHRGKWIRERLLGGAIPDTPITVDAQLPDEPDKPLRERMRVTREEFCWKCHQRMDPLGMPFEMFDHWGRYRTEEFGKPVDARGEILQSPDPSLAGPVSDAIELVNRLANSEYVEQVFVRHAFRYWMGRNETPSDAPTLQAAWRAYHDNDGSMNALLTSLLTSDAFLYRTIVTAR